MAKTAGPNGSCGVKKVKITPCAPAAFPVQYIRLRIVYKERNVLRMERIGEKAYLVLEKYIEADLKYQEQRFNAIMVQKR